MPDAILRTEGLTKAYGSLVAVKNLSLDINEGEVFGFLGPNGAGKTTAIRMMCGLLKPDAGRVLLRGTPVGEAKSTPGASVGMCPQDIVLWKRLTCLEQLQFIGEMYGLDGREAQRRSDRLLRDLDLYDRRDRQANTLSGGMQRRLNLAMALVHDPDIVVLDEPEAGLDPQSRVKVRDYIRSLAHRKTVILTTHNMDEADRLADRVAIIDHGELLVLDTPEALKHSSGHDDVLEIALQNGDSDSERARAALTPLVDRAADGRMTVDVTSDSVIVRVRDCVNMLPAALQALADAGVPCGEVHLRATTLEDVFIQLTGRRLRE